MFAVTQLATCYVNATSFAGTEKPKCNEEPKDLPNESVSSDGTEQKLEKLKHDEQKKKIPSGPDSSSGDSKQRIQISPEDLRKYFLERNKSQLRSALDKFGITCPSNWSRVQ